MLPKSMCKSAQFGYKLQTNHFQVSSALGSRFEWQRDFLYDNDLPLASLQLQGKLPGRHLTWPNKRTTDCSPVKKGLQEEEKINGIRLPKGDIQTLVFSSGLACPHPPHAAVSGSRWGQLPTASAHTRLRAPHRQPPDALAVPRIYSFL